MVLHGEYASPEARRRFRAEAEAVARIQHPHIVQIFDVGEQDGRLYFSLEYCSGGSLAAQLNGKPQPPRQAARQVATLARAVQAIHQQEIVHRDLKPANVLLTADGQPKVTDFGLARRLDQEGQTQTGAVMGTPSYMAPEQVRGDTKQVGPAADVWALGAILYECLTGRPPFKAASTIDTLAQVLEQSPAGPRSLNPGIHRDLETICLKCLEKDAGKRYASAGELADDLERYLLGEAVRARRVNSLVRGMRWVHRRRALLAYLLLLLVAVGASVSLWYWGEHHRRAAARAEREREEIQRFLEGLTPKQKETMKAFSEWLQQRPHFANMTFEAAFDLFKQDNPGVTSFANAPTAGAGSVANYAPNMVGD
jgi:serine/threonine-protein kinase